jgi:RNA polymerase sigma-70 factor (ECF subfamily)
VSAIRTIDVSEASAIPAVKSKQDEFYDEAAGSFGPAIERLAHAYEADPDLRRDLVQEIHIALWRSFAAFEGRCSLRTWLYRVAHNVATSHVIKQRRSRGSGLIGLDELENLPEASSSHEAADRNQDLARIMDFIQRLQPLDRQVILSYLEGMDAASIGEITGLSARYVSTKVYRIKEVLARRFSAGGRNAE